MGCEPYLPLSACVKKQAITEWKRSNQTKRWLAESTCKHTREIFNRSKCGQQNESALYVVDKCIAYYHQRFLTCEVYVNDGETLIKMATRAHGLTHVHGPL